MRTGITARRAAATSSLAAALVLGLASPITAVAQPEPLGSDSVTETQAGAAFRVVEGWIVGWSVPVETPEAARLEVPAAQVTLRLAGGRVGSGLASGPGSIRLATREAQLSAERSALGGNDALAAGNRLQMARRLDVFLELAQPPVPVGELALLMPRLGASPGVQGLAARLGNQWRYAMPADVEDDTASSLAAVLLGSADAVADSPAQLAERDGVTFYTFRTVHLTRDRDGALIALHRGERYVEPGEITEQRLRDGATAIADYLARQLTNDDIDSLDASLVRYALVRAHNARLMPIGRDALTLPDRDGVARDPVADAVMDAVVAPYLREGLLEAEGLPDGTAARALFDATAEFAWTGRVREAIGLWAMAEVLQDDADRERLRDDLRSLIAAAGADNAVALMPWIDMAERELYVDGERPSAVLFRQVREQLWRFQVQADDVSRDDRDFVGGIVFTRGGAQLPGDTTARAVTFAAAALRDPELTTADERSAEIRRLLAACRFVLQLVVEPVDSYQFAEGRSAVGGVRATPADAVIRPAGSALTLLMLIETLDSLRAVANAAD